MNTTTESENRLDARNVSRFLIWGVRGIMLLWLLTLGLHFETSVESSLVKKQIELGPRLSADVAIFVNTGNVKTFGIPYLLYFKYDVPPRSVNVLVDLHGFNDDADVFVEVLTEPNNRSEHEKDNARPTTLLKKWRIDQLSIPRHGYCFPNVIGRDGEASLVVKLSVSENGTELCEETIELQLSQYKRTQMGLGWYLLFITL